MKIAINSPCFLPRIGGLENVTAMLAGHFAMRGHEVRVLTVTPADEKGEPDLGFQIVRDPQGKRLWETVRWCDVFVHSNMSLKAVHPLLLLRKPWVAIHHGWYSNPEKPRSLNAMAKCLLASLATANVAVSRAVANYVGERCQVIHNPYDDATFRLMPEVERTHDLVFVGRLVSDKAPGLLIEAVSMLAQEGQRPSVTIVGDGPEAKPLRIQVARACLESQVRFTGALRGRNLAAELNAHRILVVPSVIREGFGIVALEGIACGCVVAGADAGGLPDAIGPCGRTFKRTDVRDLMGTLRTLLASETPMSQFHEGRQAHLRKHTTAVTGDAYLDVMEGAANKHQTGPT